VIRAILEVSGLVVLIVVVGAVVGSFLSVVAKDFGRDAYRVVKVRRHRWLHNHMLRRQARQLRRIELTSEDFEDWTEEFYEGSEG
jgi:hypothetical protein